MKIKGEINMGLKIVKKYNAIRFDGANIAEIEEYIRANRPYYMILTSLHIEQGQGHIYIRWMEQDVGGVKYNRHSCMVRSDQVIWTEGAHLKAAYDDEIPRCLEGNVQRVLIEDSDE